MSSFKIGTRIVIPAPRRWAGVLLRLSGGIALVMAASAFGQVKEDATPQTPGARPDLNGPLDNANHVKETRGAARPSTIERAADELVPAPLDSVQRGESDGVAGPLEWRLSKPAAIAAAEAHQSDSPEVRLDALDAAALMREDSEHPSGCKRQRISVGRNVAAADDSGRWQDVATLGRVWRVDLVSTGAVAIRVHFADLDLPAGAQLWVYSPDHPEGRDGPHLGRGALNTGEFWSGTIEGDRARVEMIVPSEAIGGGLRTPRIDQVQHVYRDPLGEMADPRGTCHNDVTCSPTFANVSHGTARISFVENGNGFLCTGQLINPQNGDLTPYFLTSNTCIATNTVAQTTQFFWLFQTSSCNGTPPSLSSVPKSSVATLGVTGTSSDFSILIAEGSLPCGLFWAGFDANAITTGLASACIHHPQGGAKRISFGTKATADSAFCSSGSPDFVRMNWTDGTSESGSEGAPIFRSDTQRVYGQLSCGPATCANPTFDNFGAMQATFSGSTTVQTLLAGGSDDALEPNDTCATAITISEGTFSNRIVKFNHDDWFRIALPAGGTLSVTLTFTNANGNIDMELFGTCGGTALASSSGTTNQESIVFTNSGAATNVLLHVFLSDCDTRNSYSMVAQASLPNDTCATATVIPGTATSFNPATYSTVQADASASEPQETCEVGNAGVSNTVWYSFTPCGSGTVTLDTFGSNYNTVLAMFTGTCTAAAQVACSDDAIGTQARLLNVPVTAGTTYLIKVSDYNTTAGGGTLEFNFAYAPTPPPNDACAAAVVIPGNASAFNPTTFCTVGATVTAGDPAESCGFTSNSNPVWYSFSPCANGHITLDTNGSDYDTVLSVFTGSCGSAVELACDDDSGTGLNSQLINVPVSEGTTYLIKAADFGNPDGGSLNFNFSYSPSFVPTNDSCASPTVIPKNTLDFAPPPYCTMGANATVSEPQESCEVGGVGVSNTVWYSFNPCESGTISLDTNGSNYDTVLSVFRGSCGAPVQVACDDDSGTGSNSQLTNVPVTIGTNYLIKVADYGGPNGGTLMFHLAYAPVAPTNDLCSAATVISGNPFNPPALCTLGATVSAGEPGEACGFPPNGSSVWYRFIPTASGSAAIDTAGSTYDTVLSVFSGACASPVVIACNDDFGGLESALPDVPMTAGTTYLIKVASFGTTNGGNLDFNFSFHAHGDLNCDGVIDALDDPLFVAALLDPGSIPSCGLNLADMNGDGSVNGRDTQAYVAARIP
ncbi:MAG: dockerin type I domain-containing protein [Planctomycetaceae bacterium]